MSTIFDYDDGADLVATGDIVAAPPAPSVLEGAAKALGRAAGIGIAASSVEGRQRFVDDAIGENPAETFAAAREAAYLSGRVDSRDLTYRQAYEPIVDALNADLRKAPMLGASPDRDKFVSNPYLYGRQVNPANEARGGANQDEVRIWARIAERRKSDPTFLSHLGRNRDEFISLLDMAATRDLEGNERTAGEGGIATRLAGSLVGGATDPVNISSTLIGAGSAKSIAVVAIREGLINAGVELAVTPIIAERRKELGQDTTAGDVLTNVGTAFGFGLTVGGLFELGARALRMPDIRSDREVLDAFDANVKEPTPEQAQAREVLAEKVEIEEASPFGDTPEAVAVHLERLDDAVVALQNDVPVARVAASEPVGALAPARIDRDALPDTRGKGEQFHGARGEVPALSEGYYNPNNIYGGFDTFYTTDAVDIAAGYGRKQDSARIYKVTEREPVTIFDMEEPRSPEEWMTFFGLRQDDDGLIPLAIEQAGQETGEPRNLRTIFDEIRAESRNEGLSKDEVQELFDGAITRLRQQGFGGMTHKGGLKTGRPAHNVKIYFDAPRQLDLVDVTDDLRASMPRETADSVSVAARVADDTPAAEAAAVRDFAEPAGKGQREQTEVLNHEVSLASQDMPTGFALAETVDGAELRTFDNIMSELDADDSAISALEACLK